MKDIKELKKLAKKIYKYELCLAKTKDIIKQTQYEDKINLILSKNSLEDILFIDELIQNKNFD